MYKFTINNGTISSAKTIDIGTDRNITFLFDFGNVEFQDDDIFQMELGSNNIYTNYSFINAGKLKFVDMDFGFIEAESTAIAIEITKNGTSILSDTITVIAQTGGGDMSDYYTKQETDALFSNELKINEITDATDTIAIAYNRAYDIVKVSNTTSTASITINPCSGYTAQAGKVPTFEMWIAPETTKTTISVSNAIQVIGDMPEQLTAGKVYCFTFRFVGSNQLLNFSHNYELETSSSAE